MNIVYNSNFINYGEVPVIKSFLSLTLEKVKNMSLYWKLVKSLLQKVEH